MDNLAILLNKTYSVLILFLSVAMIEDFVLFKSYPIGAFKLHMADGKMHSPPLGNLEVIG